MLNDSAREYIKTTLSEVARFMAKEFAASPDSGHTVTADVRPLFTRLCQTSQMIEFIDENCESVDCPDPVMAHDVEGVPLCQGCYDACLDDISTIQD